MQPAQLALRCQSAALLLAADGIDVNAEDMPGAIDGRTALHRAAAAGKGSAVTLLLAADGIDVRGRWRDSARVLARKNGHLNIASALERAEKRGRDGRVVRVEEIELEAEYLKEAINKGGCHCVVQ